MSTASITCSVSLSKKLRKLLKNGQSKLTLIVQGLEGGRGVGHLSLSNDLWQDVPMEELMKMGETNIMFTPTEGLEEMPGNIHKAVSTLFTTVPTKGMENIEPVVQKIAAVNVPEKGSESRAVQPEVKTPTAFSDVDNPSCKKFIDNLEDLVKAVLEAKTKQSGIDPDSAENPRQRALLLEAKERAESIDFPAFIVNDKVGNLAINDLDLALPLNAPFDLSKISARRIAASKELKILLRDGYIKFISPSDAPLYAEAAAQGDSRIPQLEVFDNVDQAAANMGGTAARIIDEENTMDLTNENLEAPTLEESMILDLTAGMPSSRASAPSPQEPRRSVHGNAERPEVKNPDIKTIRRKD